METCLAEGRGSVFVMSGLSNQGMSRERQNGFGIGSDCDRCTNSPGPNGNGVWVKGGVAVGGYRPWGGRAFSK